MVIISQCCVHSLLRCPQVTTKKSINAAFSPDLFSAEFIRQRIVQYQFPYIRLVQYQRSKLDGGFHDCANTGLIKKTETSFSIQWLPSSLTPCRSGTQLDRSGSAVSLMPTTVTPTVRHIHTPFTHLTCNSGQSPIMQIRPYYSTLSVFFFPTWWMKCRLLECLVAGGEEALKYVHLHIQWTLVLCALKWRILV